MRRADLVLYAGILVLLLSLLSYLVGGGGEAIPAAGGEESAGDGEEEPPGASRPAAGAGPAGWLGLARDRLASLQREGNRLAASFWKDGLTENQRRMLDRLRERLIRLRDFALSGQFLLLLSASGLLVGLYYLVGGGGAERLRRRAGRRRG